MLKQNALRKVLIGNRSHGLTQQFSSTRSLRNFSSSHQPQQSEADRWFQPNSESHTNTPIQLYNTLSRSKVPFAISNRSSNKDKSPPTINWYSCGPTVYDDTHLGHARNYVSLDIIYRILTNYFHYSIFYVMGITDVDDKILKRAMELGKLPSEISQKYEQDFVSDMKKLNVIQPSVYTRVTEHVEEIKLFIEEIERNGFAYVTQSGGVYFDSQKFEKNNHVYGKLCPNTNQEESVQQDHIEFRNEKKDPRDFALWKFTSKEKEPLGWESKWGYGRPGWHIECSAMIDSVFRKDKQESHATIDLHSGGIDLAFPHHNNEIAQSEACHHHEFCNTTKTNWCNYFIHVGHLHIHGLKMSKSLKNFITVRQYLNKYTPDQFRFFCLLHQYNQTVDYSESAMEVAIKYEKRVHDFLHNVAFYRKECEELANFERKWTQELKDFQDLISLTENRVYEAICDDFSTPIVMDHISSLINTANSLFFTNNNRKDRVALELLDSSVQYIVNLFHLFGVKLGATARQDFTGEETDEEISKHPFTSRIIDILTEFRSAVRKESLQSETKNHNILTLIDKLRDEKLKELGIRIDDRSGEKSAWRYDVTFKQDEAIEQTKPINLDHQQKLAQRQQETEQKLSISLENYFKEMPQHKAKNYSQFDEKGIPTHDHEGQPLSKSALKKLAKEWEKHAELLEKHKK